MPQPRCLLHILPFADRYGKIKSTKAIVDPGTTKCKGKGWNWDLGIWHRFSLFLGYMHQTFMFSVSFDFQRNHPAISLVRVMQLSHPQLTLFVSMCLSEPYHWCDNCGQWLERHNKKLLEKKFLAHIKLINLVLTVENYCFIICLVWFW